MTPNLTLQLPDPEVAPPAPNSRRTSVEKLRIIREADACAHGQLGALLRREGIYSSTLAVYRKQLETGKLAAKDNCARDLKRIQDLARQQQLQRKYEKLEKENLKLRTLLNLQKKVAELMRMTMETTENS